MPVTWVLDPNADPGTNGDPSRVRPSREPETRWVEIVGGDE